MAVATTKRTTASRKPKTQKSTAATSRARKPAAAQPATNTGNPTSGSPTSGAAAAPVAKAVVATAPVPTVVSITTPDGTMQEMKKKELIDRVVERSGIKKKDAKPVVEAMLGVLGESIADGRELNLPPFGKLRINRAEEKGNGKIIVCKLRQPKASAKAAGTEALAQPAEDS